MAIHAQLSSWMDPGNLVNGLNVAYATIIYTLYMKGLNVVVNILGTQLISQIYNLTDYKSVEN